MAEISGAVASGAGLVSLSKQLLESAQKLKGFYDSARDALSTVSRLSSDMKTIFLLLRQLEGFRLNQVFGDQVLDSCIKSCEEAVSKIQDSVGKVERLLLVPKTRTLGKTYMGFKEPEIRKLLEEMEHAKSSVLLAFSSYQHYHSMLRDARHEDLLRHHFTAQNERLDNLERAVVSGDLALFERIKAPQSQHLLESPESQQFLKAPKPIDPQRLALAPMDKKRHRTPDERQKQAWLRKFRVSLHPWLVNRVWEFGLREAEGGWTAQLYPIMVRPQDTYVFDFVYSGDVDTVRRLLRSGQLSVRDHSQTWHGLMNLLQVELCRFLLQESGFFRDDEILLAAFTDHAQSVAWGSDGQEWLKKRQLTESFYRVFVTENNMDVDFRNGNPHWSSPLPISWSLLFTVSSVRDIMNGQPTDFSGLPFEQRFSTATKSIGWPAETFRSIFRHDDAASLVTAVSERGTTALHWAAVHLGEWVMRALEGRSHGSCPDEIESYQTLVRDLIRMGASLHAIHRVEFNEYYFMHADPFVSFLTGLSEATLDQKDVASAVRLWGQTIAESGYSLRDYADAENLYLADLHYIYTHEHPQQYFPISVAVNNDSIMQTRLANVQYIQIWQAYPTEIPGAWPVHLGPPGIIVWDPVEEDSIDGFRWVRMKAMGLESTPRFAELAEEPNVAHSVKKELREPRAKWFNGVQDDHGPLAMMTAQRLKSNSPAYRQHVQRRSASAPPPGSFEHVVEFKQGRQTSSGGISSFVVSVHKCPFNGRWGTCGFTYQWHWCMRGDLHNTPEAKIGTPFPYPWDWYSTWECSLLNDEDRIEIAERFAACFRPEELYIVQAVIWRAEERKALKL